MTTALIRVFNCRNVSHLSRMLISQSAFVAHKNGSQSENLQNINSQCSARKICSFTNPSWARTQQLLLKHRSYSTETDKSRPTSILSQIREQEKQHEEDEEKKSEEEKQKQWRTMKLGFILMGGSLSIMSSIMIYELSRPSVDEKGNVIEDEFTNLPFFEQRIKRLLKELNYFKKFVQEPSREKLLPDPLKFPYIQPPYTVILEMKDVLVHPDWTYQTGWRFKKRPGVDQFLEAIAPPQFETVVYTAEQGMTVFPILDVLDPQGYIMYRLVRDATRFVNGHHVKDLDSLNRDLSKVIVIDWNDESVKFHPDNMLRLPRWTGNDDDTTLYDLAAFLKTIHSTNVEDVRDVLTYYRQFENPLEAFRENQRKLLEQIQEQESKAQQQQPQGKLSGTTWKPSFLKNKLA